MPSKQSRDIELRGVQVHNLKSLDVSIPANKLVIVCGVSGSGKSSLAFDTLYVEGQRRFIERFSPYTRQFLDRFDKPNIENISGIRPAIALKQHTSNRSRRATIGSVTETYEFLRLLFGSFSKPYCDQCEQYVGSDSIEDIISFTEKLKDRSKFQIGFSLNVSQDSLQSHFEGLNKDGFIRGILFGKQIRFDDSIDSVEDLWEGAEEQAELHVVVDRFSAEKIEIDRLRESIEQAFDFGRDQCEVWLSEKPTKSTGHPLQEESLDNTNWFLVRFSTQLQCSSCGEVYSEPDPRMFNYNSPMGACSTCEGYGQVFEIDPKKIVPDPSLSLREGAIVPWNNPSYGHELDELIELADDYDIPVNIPYSKLKKKHLDLIQHGVKERQFGGLDGFFRWLERRKYKMHIGIFLMRWKSHSQCPDCNGKRLNRQAYSYRLDDLNFADFSNKRIELLQPILQKVAEKHGKQPLLLQLLQRIQAMVDLGCGYLSLDRPVFTLSGGEFQRVALTKALGSGLVDTLYVMDEPTIGLHPADTQRVIHAVEELRDFGNTVIVVDHDDDVIRAADHIIELGPGAGSLGGEIVFSGSVGQLSKSKQSITAPYIAKKKTTKKASPKKAERRKGTGRVISLSGAKGNNLQDVNVEVPLGTMTVVTGVSGAGKSTLIKKTLYPAILNRLKSETEETLPFSSLKGVQYISDCLLVDQKPIGRTSRSNPATYVKAFDEIRGEFAKTPEANVRNYTKSHFSFNSESGQCPKCKGQGQIQIEMQFLPDVFLACDDCSGSRYRPEILDIKVRQKNIQEILGLDIDEAFKFFAHAPAIQKKLMALKQVGLNYLQLGQSISTLSGGEAQRLKLASFLSNKKQKETLFIFDEPTTGLHFADIECLLRCFQQLLMLGHSLIIVEHNLAIMAAADYIIDIGPGAGERGGQIVAAGTPEQIMKSKKSITGEFLKQFVN